MQKGKVRFRRPTADEQTVLLGMSVKLLVRPHDIQKGDQLLIEHHYLHRAQLVGEQRVHLDTVLSIEGVTVPRPAETQTMQAVSLHEINIQVPACSGRHRT